MIKAVLNKEVYKLEYMEGIKFHRTWNVAILKSNYI